MTRWGCRGRVLGGFFRLSERGTTVETELRALVTFLTAPALAGAPSRALLFPTETER